MSITPITCLHIDGNSANFELQTSVDNTFHMTFSGAMSPPFPKLECPAFYPLCHLVALTSPWLHLHIRASSNHTFTGHRSTRLLIPGRENSHESTEVGRGSQFKKYNYTKMKKQNVKKKRKSSLFIMYPLLNG